MTKDIFILFLVLLASTKVIAQSKNSVYIFNGNLISYAKYVSLDKQSIAESNFYENGRETRKLFGNKVKHGVLILKSQDFIDSQTLWYKKLRNEISTNFESPKIYIVNGLIIKRSAELEKWILTIPFENIEYLNCPKNKQVSDITNYHPTFIEGSMFIIRTKKWIDIPFR